MRTSLPLLLLATAAACSAPDSRQATTPPAATRPATAPLEPLDTARASAANAQSDTLKTVRRRHIFSAPGTPDEFRLVLRGQDLLTGEATFTITDASGQVIFREIGRAHV